jgi:Flp pilus assembly protein TadD
MLSVGRMKEGVERLEKIVDANPDLAIPHVCLGFAYFRASRTEDAILEMRKAVSFSKSDPVFQADLALLLVLAGQKEEAGSILNHLKEASKSTYVSDVQMACILYSLGRHDEAFEHLEKAYARRSIDLPDIRLIPEMGELRADPRWISLETRMGLRDL